MKTPLPLFPRGLKGAIPACGLALAALLAAPQIHSQTLLPARGKALKPTAPAAGVLAPKRLALLFEGQDVQPLADAFDLTLLDGGVRKGVYLLETVPGVDDNQLQILLGDLEGEAGVLFAEEDLLVEQLEVGGCELAGPGTLGQVGPQQCTVPFIDGDPTVGEYIGQRALSQIDVYEAQRMPHPHTPIVAVIDTGIDPGHPVFKGKLAGAGYDFVENQKRGFDKANGLDDDGDGLVDEAYGHGTHVAGTVLVVDPKALILPIRVLDSDGTGSSFQVSQAIFWAVDQGAHIINLSLSMTLPSKAVVSALQYAEAKGAVVITSAGNTGGQVLFPGNYVADDWDFKLPAIEGAELDGEEIITVAAVDEKDKKASFSAHGALVDVSAPGVAIYSAIPGGGFAWWSGTSMACGVASGVAALTVGIGGPFPAVKPHTLLLESADSIDDLNPDYQGALGVGRLNATAAGLAAGGTGN